MTLYAQRWCVSVERQCPSPGASISLLAVHLTRPQASLSSSTLSASRVLHSAELTRAFRYGFSSITHQGLGVFSTQLQKKLTAVLCATYVCLFLRYKLYPCLYIDTYNSEISQSVLTVMILTASTVEKFTYYLQHFRLEKKCIWAECYQTSHP